MCVLIVFFSTSAFYDIISGANLLTAILFKLKGIRIHINFISCFYLFFYKIIYQFETIIDFIDKF